jgi:hypothetical protein
MNCRVVTTHEEMLAIVHHRTSCGIKKRARSPAEIRPLFEQANPLTCLRQRHTRGQAGETATDDENIMGHGPLQMVNENRNSKFETRHDFLVSSFGFRPPDF